MQNHPKNEARSGNFLFIIGEDREITMAAQSCNVADLTLGFAPFPSGVKDLFIPGNKIETDPLVVGYIISEDWNEWLYLYKWILAAKNDNAAHLFQTKTCEIVTLDSQNQPGVRFRYLDCIPNTMEGVQFAIDDDGNKVIVSTTTIRYNELQVIDKQGNIINFDYTGESDLTLN
jgi:hypothetical protein